LQRELRRLKRGLRDLVALSVMPAAWVGRDPREIANGFLELLFSTLRLDAAYVCIDPMAGEQGCEVAQCSERPDFQKWVAENKEKLRPRRKLEGVLPPVLLPFPSGETLRLETRAIGMQLSFGFVVVGSCRPDFPTEEEKLLLSVAANQAATALQAAQLSAERAAVSKELLEREQRFRSLSACSPVGFVLTDTSGKCVYTNARCQEICGFTFEQALGEGWAEFVHPDDRDRVFREWTETAMAGGQFAAEFRWGRSDGDIRWTYVRSAPQISDDGRLIGHVGTVEDVTERKQAEEARHRLAAIVESSDDAIISKDLNGIVASWNRGAEVTFGYKAEEMIGRSILTIIPPELRSDEDMILSNIRNGKKTEHFETVRLTKSGERVEVSLSISPVRDDQGKIIGAAKIARNITEKKRIERALRTTEKLAAAGRLAATVAHEINNPLEAVTNLVFLAKRDLSDARKTAAHLDLAERELGRVAHIARQTLGFYRETSSPSSVNIVKTLDDLLYLYEKRLETRSIQVQKRFARDVEITALPGEIRQAFSNLISNAIDAMPHGGTLLLKVSESHGWSGQRPEGVRISVLDTGSGIARQDRKHLFEPFFTTKADVGTGLGLWITKNIVEKHGGTIRFRSKAGAGTVFSVYLPLSGKNPEIGPDMSRLQATVA
jgi:PAS domain S-box-containing protein